MYLVMFHKNWKSFLRNIAVTSLAEVWIETRMSRKPGIGKESLPLRKCGLKRHWNMETARYVLGHFPCGSVD